MVRKIVLWTLCYNFQFKAVHLKSSENLIADFLSRGKMEQFKKLAPLADDYPTPVPAEFMNLLI